jgi:hypothetical protein
LELVDRLDWSGKKPTLEELAPVVSPLGDGHRVVFHTLSSLGREHVTRWTDTYADGYQPHTETEGIAVGDRGFVF